MPYLISLPPSKHNVLTRWLSSGGSGRSSTDGAPDPADDDVRVVTLPDGAVLTYRQASKPFESCGLVAPLPPTPLVHADAHSFTVLTGLLSSLDQLMERLSAPASDDDDAAASPRAVAALAPASLPWADWSTAVAEGRASHLGASVLAAAVGRARAGGALVPLLADLHGSHAFVAYDAARRTVLAARDAGGAHPLWVAEGGDGGVAFTDDPASDVARGWRGGACAWREVPPGHYVAGRPEARAKQYMLTAAQLRARARAEEAGWGEDADGGDRGDRGPRVVARARSALGAKLAAIGGRRGRAGGGGLATSL